VPNGEIRGALVPGKTVPRLGVPVHQNWISDRPGVREGVPRERRGHTGHPGKLATGSGRMG